jgi:hypothetical protein
LEYNGINKAVDADDLQPGESPDAVNCFFHGDTLNLLGPRAGKTFTNSTAYDDAVYGIIRYVEPHGGRNWLISQNDGTVDQVDAKLTTEPTPTVPDSFQLFTFDNVALSVSYPSNTHSVTKTLHQSIPIGSYEYIWPRNYSVAASATGGTESMDVSVAVTLLDADDNGLAGYYLELFQNQKTSLTIAANPLSFRKRTLTLSSVATQVKMDLTIGGGSGVTDYSGTASPFNFFALR